MQRKKLKDVVLECHEMWSHVLKHTKKHKKNTKKHQKNTKKTPGNTWKQWKTEKNMDFGQKTAFFAI